MMANYGIVEFIAINATLEWQIYNFLLKQKIGFKANV